MPRLFVAAELSSEALKLAATHEERLQQILRRRVRIRWTRPEGRHVTLAFLGQVDTSRVKAAGDATRGVAQDETPIQVEVGGLGAFPSARRARVLWLAVTDAGGRLERLANRIQDALRSTGFTIDQREFRGHVTVGRVADRRGVELIDAIDEGIDTSVSVTLDSVVLFESQLSPSGARYQPLQRIALGPPAMP